MRRLPEIALGRAVLALTAVLAVSGCAGIDGRTAGSHLLSAIVRGLADVRDAERYVDPCQSAGSTSVHCPRNFGAITAFADASPAHWQAAADREREQRANAYRLALHRFIAEQDARPATAPSMSGPQTLLPGETTQREFSRSPQYGLASYPDSYPDSPAVQGGQ